jgi:hypothetical protein
VQTASSGTLAPNNDGDNLNMKDTNSTVINSHQYGSEAGDNQSITRDPDITGPNPMIRPSLAISSGGTLFSPDTRIDSSAFSGCSIKAVLKSAKSDWKQ